MYHVFFWIASACVVGCLFWSVFLLWQRRIDLSRRKIKRQRSEIKKEVIVEIGGSRNRMSKHDIPLFLAENMDALSAICEVEMPDLSAPQDKMCREHDLKKIVDFMEILKEECFKRGILKNDLQIGGDGHEGKD